MAAQDEAVADDPEEDLGEEDADDEENMLAHIGNVKELLQQEMQHKMQEDGELEEEGPPQSDDLQAYNKY